MLDLDSKRKDADKRFIKINGIEINITLIPALTSIMYDQIAESFQDLNSDKKAMDLFDKSAEAIMITITANGNEGITKEWLMSNCSFSELQQILIAIHADIKKKGKEAEKVGE